MPTLFGSKFGSAQIMQGAITAQKIKLRPPDILLRPAVERFNVLEFMRAGQILLAAEPAKVAEYRAGRDKLFGFFVGAVMKAMSGKANPKVINDLLRAKLGG